MCASKSVTPTVLRVPSNEISQDIEKKVSEGHSQSRECQEKDKSEQQRNCPKEEHLQTGK
jgi:hypothetical protein